jgi:hypothetical protein
MSMGVAMAMGNDDHVLESRANEWVGWLAGWLAGSERVALGPGLVGFE